MYFLDTNVFIQARNLHYGFDICPGFWDWLVEQNRIGSVASIEKVADELRAGGDDLAAWARERGGHFFLRPDAAVADVLGTVSRWAKSGRYEPGAAATFLRIADYWLVAHALAHDGVVVTHEVRANTVRKIKIPNACEDLGVSCVTPYEMLRRERARFVLEHATAST